MKENQNSSFIMDCKIISTEKNKDFKMGCNLHTDSVIQKKHCIKFYVLPFYIPNYYYSPYEVIIPDKLEIINEYKKEGIQYDIEKINNIFNKLNIPINYNFIEETNAPVYKKEEGECKSSLTLASVTALSYRYFKKGIKVNLSAQYPLSCSLNNCKNNNYDIDSQLDLVKNGTVTEECFPYSSNNGIIEKCPIKCKDGSEFKKYYASNAYKSPETNEINFYDIVELMIDQIYNCGPIVSTFDIYEDLINSIDCNNNDFIYSLKNNYKSIGRHSGVIVGFGYLNSKFFWIVQTFYVNNLCNSDFI